MGAQPLPNLGVTGALSGPSSPCVAMTLGGSPHRPPSAWRGPRFRVLAPSHWGLERGSSPPDGSGSGATNR